MAVVALRVILGAIFVYAGYIKLRDPWQLFAASIASGDVSISGNPLKLGELFGLLDEFSPGFEIVEPRKAAVE